MGESVIQIPEELFVFAESSCFSDEIALEPFYNGPDLYVFDEPVTWDVEISNTGNGLYMTGKAHASGVTSCARCLEDVRIDFESDIEEYFTLDPRAIGDGEDADDDECLTIGEDRTIDMEPIAIAALVLDMPLVPLCSDDCQGLCAHCGANLNEGPCSCETDEVDETNPFAVLKNLDIG